MPWIEAGTPVRAEWNAEPWAPGLPLAPAWLDAGLDALRRARRLARRAGLRPGAVWGAVWGAVFCVRFFVRRSPFWLAALAFCALGPGGWLVPACRAQQGPPLNLPASLPAVPAPALAAVSPRYLVLLDAAHGGAETGARLSELLLEKDLALALSVRLRSILAAHGITVVTTRESDTNPLPDARAGAANRAHASACLLLHATTSGTGVHLYTSSLSPAPAAPGLPRAWATAQAAFITQSLKLSSDLSEALGHAAIPVTLGSVSVPPVDSMACPAVILEVAPLLPRRGKGGAALGDPDYQTRLVDALGGALEQWRADWKSQP